MEVKLLNKEECKNFFKTWGEFSSVCYNTDKKYAEKVGKTCFESGHYSGSRAFSFNFEVKGISRRCSHQLVRHSVGVTVNQKSQRYCDESFFDYVVPPKIRNRPVVRKKYDEFMKSVNTMYRTLNGMLYELEGIQEDTRYVLPNACTTDLTIGFTLEALIHFCEERLCTASQWEIRELAENIKQEVIEVLPELESKLNSKCINLGYCPESEKRCCGRKPNKNKIKIIELEEN